MYFSRISKRKAFNYISEEEALKQILDASEWNQRLMIAHRGPELPNHFLTGE